MADTEVKGSGREWETNKFNFGERLSVGAASTDAPSIGGYFDPPGAIGADSGVTGRVCVRVDKDKESLPGIWLFRSTFQGFNAV